MTVHNLRVAVIGCGRMGQHHLKAIGTLDGAEVVAVADVNASTATIGQLPAGARVFQDPERMLREAEPDVVHVVTPPDSHVALARLVLEHGAHLYLEKPFAQTRAEAQAILDLARERGRSVCAGHQLLSQPSAIRARELIERVGEIVHVESYFSFNTVRRTAKGSITPTEQLLDILPHPVYMLLSVLTPRAGAAEHDLEVRSVETDASGEARAVVRVGRAVGLLVVTLRGRPIESYLRVVGTTGSLHVDLVLSGVTKNFGPGTSSVSALLQPFSTAAQITTGTLGSLFRMVRRKHKSYTGLAELIEAFYRSLRHGSGSPTPPRSILDTVGLCEQVAAELGRATVAAESAARERLEQALRTVPPVHAERGVLLVTGGSGFLGRFVLEDLRSRGWSVRAVVRQLPSAAQTVPGVDYCRADLSSPLPMEIFDGVRCVAHLAAETRGDKRAHELNTIQATRMLVESMVRAGVPRLVHVSSLAVLKPRRWLGPALNEDSPVDVDNLERGPYVWAKAAAETMVNAAGLSSRIIRLGPLVDFEAFSPPGRLGREVGPFYFAVGSPRDALSICDVRTAVQVVRYTLERFDAAPPLLNLVDSRQHTRRELVARLRSARPDLRVFWLPMPVVWTLSNTLRVVQPLVRRGSKAVDLYAAFAAERYDLSRAREVIGKACAGDTGC